MNIPIITVYTDTEAAQGLIQSATKHGWDVIGLKVEEWKGFGTKIITVYEYLKAHPEIERFIFCDAYDVIVLGTPGEFERKIDRCPMLDGCHMLVSSEKNLWPPILHPFKVRYNDFNHGFNYPNSGLYYAKSKFFIAKVEMYMPSYETDDQYWMNLVYLFDDDDMDVNFEQSLFNSHSFIAEGEYIYNNNRVQIMGNEPIFIHLNGRTVDEKLNQMLGL